MRHRLIAIPLILALAACATGAVDESTTSTAETTTSTTHTLVDDPPAGSPAEVVDRPVWEGYQATASTPPTLAALALAALDVYESPESVAPEMTLDHATILGTVTVLGVVGQPADGWIQVMLPVRPNGSTGWVRASDVYLYVADSEIVVDLGKRRLSYLIDGVEVLSTEVGVGSRYNETPIGEYFVTDSVTLANPNSAWGPHALGTSARSETITEFNGGDGIIGIHGTNNPSSIGGNISLGCVRLPNDMITALHAMVPIGTRVLINA